ncbi:uncharacterized protein OCT59_027557 [Rhizophagus irregularis]|uniref:uncharacterized protein n=1 Tax=Rhizophagus irregularis TaxID=588596 RepID=UPI00332B1E44|nr:hypothetical protein OCT59_027557 [Rhizophagus irregularis]
MQLKFINRDDVVFEWIPYSQFYKIQETSKNGLTTVHSAIWKDGPIYWYRRYVRSSNKKVALKYLHTSQDSINFLVNETKKYSTKYDNFLVLYGISQNPDTNDYILVQDNSINLANWNSGNEKIDDFIQEMQLKVNNIYDIVFEWIPYNQLDEVKEIDKNGSIIIYSAIRKDGPLYKKYWNDYKRDSSKNVALKCFQNSQDSIDFLINETKKYSINYKTCLALYGISQNPDTNDYILVQSNSINLANWNSGNEKIDDFIQKMQLKMNNYCNVAFEWIPFNQLGKIKEIGKNGSITIYSAIWKDGPLCCNIYNKQYVRYPNKVVALKYLHNSQNSIDFLINEAKKYSTQILDRVICDIYGISQNQETNDYILVLAWASGNEKIDDFVQEMQLKINNKNDVVFEWIPYCQFRETRRTGKNGPITVYSARWNDGPIYYNNYNSGYTNTFYKKVALKYLHNSQNSIDFLINEAKKYYTKMLDKTMCNIYGISHNPYTNNYILVMEWTSGNEKIDDFIQEMELKVIEEEDLVFEWIPYNQFNKIKEISKDGPISIYSAIYKDGPIVVDDYYGMYKSRANINVFLKYLHNSQNYIEILTNEVRKLLTSIFGISVLRIYGISQNPDTSDYILVQRNFTSMSGNKKIDDFIQEIQLKISNFDEIVFEWIPYNQLYEINEIKKNGSITVYSAIWENGPFILRKNNYKYTRDSTKTVALNYLHNSQNSVDSLINEAKKYLTKSWDGANNDIYGISQNPNTNNYILVLVWTNWLSWSRRPSDTARHQGREWQTEKFLTDTSCVTRWKIEPDLEKLNKIYSFKTDDLYNIVIIPLKISTI